MGLFREISEIDFKDADLKFPLGIGKAAIKGKLKFSNWFPRFKKAQKWLDYRINEDMRPYLPVRTGALRDTVYRRNEQLNGTGKICIYAMPYGRKVYQGISSNGGQMRYTNPLTTPYWFNTVKSIYQESWRQGAEDIVKGKK